MTNLPYAGSKTGMATVLVDQMPCARTYTEPFAGRGNVLWAVGTLAPWKFDEYHINDIATAPLFEAIMRYGGEVRPPRHTRLDILKKEYKKYMEYKNRHHGLLTPRGAVLEPFLCSHAGTYSDSGPVTKPLRSETYREKIRQCFEILKRTGAVVTALDWHDLHLEQLGPDSFVYLDPPYRDCSVRSYGKRKDRFDYDGMVSMLRSAKFRWLLSEYGHGTYLEALGEPFLRVPKRNKLSNTDEVECLWKNY
jgi:site-specific DNA-adenine methylase